MKMICDVPDEVIKSVKMGTWCGSSVAEKMIANGIPLDELKAEIERKANSGQRSDATIYGMLKAVAIIDKYKAESKDKLYGNSVDIDKAVEHYEETLEALKDIDLGVDG